MNALAGIRPAPYSAVSFEAFRLTDGRTYSLDIGDPSDLADALRSAQTRCFLAHKEHLAIRETDEAGARVHLYAIRKAAPKWVHPAGELVPRRVADLYADPVCVMDGAVFG